MGENSNIGKSHEEILKKILEDARKLELKRLEEECRRSEEFRKAWDLQYRTSSEYLKRQAQIDAEILAERRKQYLAQKDRERKEFFLKIKSNIRQFFVNLPRIIVSYLILGILGLVILGYYVLWVMAVIGNAIGPLDDSVLTAPFRK